MLVWSMKRWARVQPEVQRPHSLPSVSLSLPCCLWPGAEQPACLPAFFPTSYTPACLPVGCRLPAGLVLLLLVKQHPGSFPDSFGSCARQPAQQHQHFSNAASEPKGAAAAAPLAAAARCLLGTVTQQLAGTRDQEQRLHWWLQEEGGQAGTVSLHLHRCVSCGC